MDEFEEVIAGIGHDDGLAAKQHLAAGRAIYFADDTYPEGLIKKYPDGRLELIAVGADGTVSVVRSL